VGGGEAKERILRGEAVEVHYMYTHEDSIMKPTKCSLKERKEGEGKW
jgi:hypothetical protein